MNPNLSPIFCIPKVSAPGRPFVIGDCAAASAESCGKALFGAPDSSGEFPGWLRLANGGTLTLLDLTAMPREVQRSLAWALATRQAQCVDADAPYPLDVRIVATSRAEPGQLVEAGALDPELSKRLCSAVLRVPPLRERADDLPSLILLELTRAARVLGRPPIGVETSVLQLLQRHDWPGNLDELRWFIERAVSKAGGSRVESKDLPAPVGVAELTEAPREPIFSGALEAVERRILEQAMANAGGNKSRAARLLGLKRTTFLDKLKRYGLDEDKAPPA